MYRVYSVCQFSTLAHSPICISQICVWSQCCSSSTCLQVNADALLKRYNQGWLMEWTDDLDACIDRIKYVELFDPPCDVPYTLPPHTGGPDESVSL